MWPCGHSQNVVMAQGNNMEVALGMDVTRGHVGTARNGGGTGHGCATRPPSTARRWRWRSVAVAHGHVGTAPTLMAHSVAVPCATPPSQRCCHIPPPPLQSHSVHLFNAAFIASTPALLPPLCAVAP